MHREWFYDALHNSSDRGSDADVISVSVVIPTYNRKETLARAIASVQAQDYAVSEIIIVDDGSTDGSADLPILADERITYLVNAQNLGSQASRNRGIRQATGDVLAFLDSDDYWRPDKIDLQLQAAQDAGLTDKFCVTCGHEQFGDNGGSRFLPPALINLETVLVHNLIGPTSNILISRALLDDVGHFDASMPSCQDWELFIRILEQTPIIGVPEILTYQDTDSNVRISRNRKKVTAGHQALFRKTRTMKDFMSLSLSKRWAIRARQEIALLRRSVPI
ncbi:glycosyltransferase family 2 protein [Sphingobium boeckii]|uniref:Glycosyltransferase involved in cell wall biosynthesis n=1 Tax=Sphingobium boeckii TaxID=1082345 RepID=A0A7W9AHT1_9SPHN|nr:glycosyltransferase family A protein [Sphingobium boeckii]MBB5685751.1 glycosyltransferase involved in cell wall biosynthesis [Sphingobium boeckii]